MSFRTRVERANHSATTPPTRPPRHLTNRFRGAAHAECNRNYRIPKFIPVIFHNLSNYDADLFIKKIFIKNPKERLQCIPNNEEMYISFSKEMGSLVTSKNVSWSTQPIDSSGLRCCNTRSTPLTRACVVTDLQHRHTRVRPLINDTRRVHVVFIDVR